MSEGRRAALARASHAVERVVDVKLHARSWDARRVRVGFATDYLGTLAEPALIDAAHCFEGVYRRALRQGRSRGERP